MSQFYCDSKKLEKNWFYWLISSATPILEEYRKLGLLWTKIIGEVEDDTGNIIKKDGNSFPDPCFPNRVHCLALPVPVFFNSYSNAPQTTGMATFKGTKKVVNLITLVDELNLLSDSWLHRFVDPFVVITDVIPDLEEKGYLKEIPTRLTWDSMLTDIEQICLGITTKFHLQSDEERHDLAHEALVQVIRKLEARKLVYTPGKAPVFNLLTTTIFRCMYSIQNRKKHQREGLMKLGDSMQAGILPDNIRSFRAGMYHKRLAGRRLIRTH